MDATVADQMIRFPTDIGLLNEAREISEALIDVLYKQTDGNKPRTYRIRVRKDFLAVSKRKRAGCKLIRKGIRQQLQYLRRNLKHIENMLDKRMPQPGMAGRNVEFGSKVSVSMLGKLAFVDRLDWDAFNESQDLIAQVERYKERFGFYPEVVLADGIYGMRKNRIWLKDHGIRFGGKPLGRPRKVTAANREDIKQQIRQRRMDERSRIPIEGKFGQGKNGYRLNQIRARLASTSEAWVPSIFLVMNLIALLRFLLPFLRLSSTIGILTVGLKGAR